MENDLKKIQKLIKLMKKSGVLTLKCGGTEIVLSNSALTQESKTYPTEKEEKQDKQEGQYTEEEMLMWSSPGLFPGKADQ